jgi:hypothetical protein
MPLLSASCQRLLEISRIPAEDVDIGELDRIISHDPSMASRVLRVVNSPHYGSRTTVPTVRQAIVVIGLTDLTSLLMVTSLMAGFRQDTAMANLSPSGLLDPLRGRGGGLAGLRPALGRRHVLAARGEPRRPSARHRPAVFPTSVPGPGVKLRRNLGALPRNAWPRRERASLPDSSLSSPAGRRPEPKERAEKILFTTTVRL